MVNHLIEKRRGQQSNSGELLNTWTLSAVKPRSFFFFFVFFCMIDKVAIACNIDSTYAASNPSTSEKKKACIRRRENHQHLQCMY